MFPTSENPDIRKKVRKILKLKPQKSENTENIKVRKNFVLKKLIAHTPYSSKQDLT
jgi:hypothetical protein